MSADFTPEKKDIKILTPFKMQVLTNFPYIEADFDALTNYQLLCKIVEYLNSVIHNENELTEEVTGLYDAYIALQNYVNDYFDNLDIQEDVNNKLDEMAESGELTDIIAQYLGLAGMITFNNVSEMKLAENLVNGSKCCTLGYYTANDGGNALYRVRTITNEDVIDEATLIALYNNILVAELIIENEYNVKQFGAKGDGVSDDTSKIQNAINKCKETVLDNNLVGDSVVILPGGKYKITSTLITYPYIRIKTSGSVIITTAIDDVALKLDAGQDALSLVEYNLAYVIDGSNGLRIENTNEEATNSIGLYIVNYSGTNRRTCNFTINCVAFNGFKIATKITNHNFYLTKFEDVTFGGNDIGVQFGDSSQTSYTNSGENLVFNRCIFVNKDALKFYYAGQDCNFFNCSFDFCQRIFNDNNNKGYRKLYINGGHIEGITDYIVNQMQYSLLIITGCRFYVSPNKNLFGATKPCDIILKNNAYAFSEDPNQDPTSFIIPYINHVARDNMMAMDNTGKPFNFASIVPHHTFDNVEAGEITYTADGYIGSYQMKGKANLGTLTCLNTNIFGSAGTGKIIQFTKNDPTSASSYITLRSDFIPVTVGDKYRIYIAGRNCFGNNSVPVTYYDNNKTSISTTDAYIYNSTESTTSNDYKISKHYANTTVPNNAAYMRVSYNFGNNNSESLGFEIAGIFVERY